MSGRPRRLAWSTNPRGRDVQDRIRRVRDAVEDRVWRDFPARFGRYEMGAEEATTRVRPPGGSAESFSTTDNMHSEMVAIDQLLTRGDWRLSDDGRVETAGGRSVAAADFETVEPHCRFCSIFCALLDLPIRDGAATTGNYNHAGNLTYPLPAQVRDDPLVLGRLLTGGGSPAESLTRVREEIDLLINAPSDSWALRIDHRDGSETSVTEAGVIDGDDDRQVVTWDATADARPINVQSLNNPSSPRQYLWRLVFRGIYEARP